MSLQTLVLTLLGLSLTQGLSLPSSTSSAQAVFEWIKVDYDWQSPQQKQQYISDGRYIVEKNAPAGVKYYKGTYYMSVPRWLRGVPSTLNTVYIDQATGQPMMRPFPSWEWQQEGNYSVLQYVQSMEIDSRGWMWIVDVGRRNIFEPDPSVIIPGPPKLIIWDLNTNCEIRRHVFPDAVAPYNGSFLNDIVIDETLGFAYISDTGPPGAIVVYDFNKDLSHRWTDVTFEENATNPLIVNGKTYYFNAAEDGIALSADNEVVYYCALTNKTLHSVPARILRDFTFPQDKFHAMTTLIGTKGFSDGLAFSNNGKLYFGDEEQDAVYEWNPKDGPLEKYKKVLVQDSQTVVWVDTFTFVEGTNLTFTANTLPLFFAGQLKFDGSTGPNFRLWTIDIMGGSYLSGDPLPPKLPCKN